MSSGEPMALEQDPDLVVGVLPDVPAIDRLLDYLVPARWVGQIEVGTVVRIPLQGRRVRGWVCELGRRPPEGVVLREISKISGRGPDADMLQLAHWAAWRWAGRPLTFVRAATPLRTVHALPSRPRPPAPAQVGARAERSGERAASVELAAAAFAELDAAALDASTDHRDGAPAVRTIAWPPGQERLGFALEAVRRGPALLLTASQHEADALARALRAEGHWIARHPDDWAAGAAGATVIGSRAAVWAPVAGLRTVVVFDEHDERYQDERTPTWHARDVALERARRAGAAALLVSPLPSLEARAAAPLLAPSRSVERAGWPVTTVVDRRELDPRAGLYGPEVVDALRSGGRVVVVHNRIGRAKLLACTRCGELCRCEQCGAAMQSSSGAAGSRVLRCASAGHPQPELCPRCGATRLAVLRPGVGRIREEVEALIGGEVIEVTAAAAAAQPAGAHEAALGSEAGSRVWVGTEAVLHRVRRADTVIFLDFDQELLAPRYRAAERALALAALAARLVGGRRREGRIVVQTRQPEHEVVQAMVHGDPDHWAVVDTARRRALGFPPFAALALLQGEGAAEYAEALVALGAVHVLGPTEGRYLVRAEDVGRLADGLAAAPRPLTRLRIVVDPAGI